jgi:multiple sugar transport system substrate-binding protein
MRTTRGLVGTILAGTLIVASCVGGDDEDPAGGDAERNADAESYTLRVMSNAALGEGAKNAEEAMWITEYVIPEFEAAQEAEGIDVTVEFVERGVDDDDYKNKLALDMGAEEAADVIAIDGIWVGEFAAAQEIAPLDETVGADEVSAWEGWDQIPDTIASLMEFDGDRYGVPAGTDGRVIYYRKDLFQQAGLPADWQPTSWQEILDAAEALGELPGVTPMQLNAGTAMTEATTMQGFLPLLNGTGVELYADGKWQGATPEVVEVLEMYATVYSGGLGDPNLQKTVKGRDDSFLKFADGEIGMLIESDYFWRDVVNPRTGVAPMDNRDDVVGWALIPAQEPGSGIEGKDFLSLSGGGGWVVNPDTEYPQQAWDFLTFMLSKEALLERLANEPQVSPRTDVNDELLRNDPHLAFIADEVLPITDFRPALEEYTDVSLFIQEATLDVVNGADPAEAAQTYEEKLIERVGEDAVVTGSG